MKKMTKAMLMTALICGTMYCGAEPVYANELDTFTLDEYVVTATRTPVTVFDANANINVVTAKDIERQHYEDLQDVLRDVPGVTIMDYGRAGFNLSAGLRLNGSNNIVVLVDGVRVTQANVSSFPASGYAAIENIERVEVLKGSATTLYGADAKGGVINIITKNPNETKTKFIVAGGSFGNEQYSLHNEGKNGKWGYSIDVSKRLEGDFEDGRGKETPQHLDAENVGINVFGEFNEKTNLKLSYNNYKSDFTYFDEFYGGGLTKGTYDNSDFGVVLNHKFDDQNTNRFSLKRLEYDVHRVDLLDDYNNKVTTLALSDQFTNINGKNTLVTGLDYSEDDIDYLSYSTPLNEKVDMTSFYIRDEYKFDDKSTLAAGVRFDDHSIAGSEWTSNFNYGYKFTEDTNMYISYSEFFVAPQSNNYFGTYGNPNLKPETGDTIEIGVNHKFDDTFAVTAHAFKTDSNNKVTYDYGIWKYVNAAEEELKGYDIQFNKVLTDNVNVFAGYTYTDVKETGDGYVSNNSGGYIPKHAINLGVNYTDEKWDVGLKGRAAIDRGGKYSSYFPVDNYWIFDIAANYKATKNIKAFVKVNNIFDKFYAEHSAVSTPGDERWYAMPGRTILVGMEYSF